MITGCSDGGAEDALVTYRQKLERVLEQGVHPLPRRQIPRLPPVRELTHNEPSQSLDVLGFLRLGQCELRTLVADRNSVLGKLARPSQRLVYELNFQRLGERCVLILAESEPELADALRDVVNEKRDRMPRVIWQATLGGDELRHFWQYGNDTVPFDWKTDGVVLLALNRLDADVGRWLSGDYTVDSAALETTLKTIAAGNGGRMLKAFELLGYEMDLATKIVANRQARRPLCFDGMKTPNAEIFGNVVVKDFIGLIQVWVASLNRHYYEIFPVVRQLEIRLAAGEAEAYGLWRKERDIELERATGALKRHVAALNPLMDQCNLLPSRNVHTEAL